MSTKGQQYAGIRPGNDEMQEVTQVRQKVAEVIDYLEQLQSTNPRVNRLKSIAETKFEEAVMFAVKAIYVAAEPEDYIVPTAHDPAID